MTDGLRIAHHRIAPQECNLELGNPEVNILTNLLGHRLAEP